MPLSSSTCRFVCLVLVLCVYILLGACVFSSIEKPIENDLENAMMKIRKDFLQGHNCLQEPELSELIRRLIYTSNRGVVMSSNTSSPEGNWDFGQALFFSGTILTTIGYGHVTPLSEEGKLFCIVFAVLGLPITWVMITAVVENLMVFTNLLLRTMSTHLSKTCTQLQVRLLHVGLLLLLLLLTVFILPACVFSHLEESWNFLDAFYYCFISMTTIGLGDYIPGDQIAQPHRAVYKVLVTAFLFYGIISMMLVLSHLYEIPELNIGYYFYLSSDDEKHTNKLEEKPVCDHNTDSKDKEHKITAKTDD